jgi:CubicO group peptidase (beta-lactamase class C family)
MNRFFTIAITCFFITQGSLAGGAQNTSADAVDNYVIAEMNKQRVPGLELGVYREGKVVRTQGYGLANIELNVPVKPESIFQSGSVGKQFTATAVMMLVEEGKVGLDDSIRKYFPEARAAWQDVRIQNLLSHTSGLSEYESSDKVKPGGPINLRADYTEDQLVKIIESFPMDFSPGSKWAYRNTNYVLLGVIIHKVTGEFYGDFLQDRIFKPLGMSSTRIINEADIIPNRSSGYQIVKGQLKNQDWVSPTFNSTADGALYFNALDLAKWDAALYTEKLLKRSSLDRMWTVFNLNEDKPNSAHYGFAWELNEINGHKVIEHAGAWQGFTTFIARYVDDKLTVVVLTNLDSAHSNPEKIAHHVAGLYNAALTPPELRVIPDREPQVTAFLRKTLEKIASGKADPNDFAPEFRAQLFPNDIKDEEENLKAAGPLKSLELLERKEEGQQRKYTYRATFEEMTLELHFSLTADNKIAAMEASVD